MSSTESQSDRRQLRRRARGLRQKLGRRRQLLASRRLFRRLRGHPWLIHSRRIAFYLASAREGEIDPAPLLRRALKLGKHCYLPVMRRDGPDALQFVRYKSGERLRRGRYGIPQPSIRRHRPLPASSLDLVLVPLAAFDAAGNRLGMGKGYYDRTFAFKQGKRRGRPRLLGLAHECQKVEGLKPAPWDVPLQAIATPDRLYHRIN